MEKRYQFKERMKNDRPRAGTIKQQHKAHTRRTGRLNYQNPNPQLKQKPDERYSRLKADSQSNAHRCVIEKDWEDIMPLNSWVSSSSHTYNEQNEWGSCKLDEEGRCITVQKQRWNRIAKAQRCRIESHRFQMPQPECLLMYLRVGVGLGISITIEYVQ